MARLSDEERLAKLNRDRDQLDAQIRDAQARVAEKKRKEKAQRSAVIGDVVQDHADEAMKEAIFALVRDKVKDQNLLKLFEIDSQ